MAVRDPQANPSTDEAKQPPPASAPPARTGTAPGPLRVAVENPARPPRPDSAQKHQHLAKRQAAVLEVLAGFLDEADLRAGLMALAGELQNRFRCDRVAVGLYDRQGRMEVVALSQQASFDPRSAEVRLLAEALVEACDQDAVIHFPAKRSRLRIVDAHRALAAGRTRTELCTVPLCHQDETLGAILLERTTTQPWASLTLGLFRQIAAMIAPVVAFRREAERSLVEVARSGIGRGLTRVFGPRHLAAKLGSAVLLLTLLGANFIPVTHRVTADGELVPTERRVITAPIMGYIEAVDVGPGDEVARGQVLLRLDTRDLELERTKWENEIQTNETEFRSAMAAYDRKAMAVAQARQRQANAQLELIHKQISRAAITAPVAGIVVAGDLSQALGAPVELGETLLEIAPGEDYEIHLLVDEKDVGYVAPEQTGSFALAAAPTDGLPFRVKEIQPIAEARDGSNLFRVKARPAEAAPGVRPGQTGVGKIAVGEASLLWVWTHRFVDWVRLKAWELSA